MTTQAFSIKTRQPINLIDEESLLTEEDKILKEATRGEDCTTRRRACKNCSCGRAELEQKLLAAGNNNNNNNSNNNNNNNNKESEELFQIPAGGCGSCAKGDAFRCASCPFLGQPAFDNTSDGKVKLNLTDDI